MGSRYRPKYRAGDGSVKESAIIWLKYRDSLGVLRRESSGTEKEQEAKRVLRQKEGAAEAGRLEAPRADRITVAQLAEDLTAEYTANGRRSQDRLRVVPGPPPTLLRPPARTPGHEQSRHRVQGQATGVRRRERYHQPGVERPAAHVLARPEGRATPASTPYRHAA